MDTGTQGRTGSAAVAGASRGRGRRWALAAVVLVAAVVGFVAVWFEPQKLFIDERVDQAVPTARSSATSAPPGRPDGGPAAPAPARPGAG